MSLRSTISLVAALYIFKDQFYEISPTVGSSMFPTFDIFGDFVLLNKYKKDQISVGDVISAISPIEPNKLVLKRIIGMEGDIVKFDPLDPNSKYIRIPKGKLWIVGDNLRFSRDSRDYGPISMGLVHGKAIAKIGLFKFQWLENGLRDFTDEIDDQTLEFQVENF